MRERFHYSGLFFFFNHSEPIQSRQFKRKFFTSTFVKPILLNACHFCKRSASWDCTWYSTAQLGTWYSVNYSGERPSSCRRQPGIRSTSLRANTAISSRSSPLGKFRGRFFVSRGFLSPRNARSLVATGRRRDGCICRVKIDHFCFYIVLWAVCLLPVTRYKVNWKLNILKRHDSQKRKKVCCLRIILLGVIAWCKYLNVVKTTINGWRKNKEFKVKLMLKTKWTLVFPQDIIPCNSCQLHWI